MKNDKMKNDKMKKNKFIKSKLVVFIASLLVFMITFAASCSDIEYETTQDFTSPSGNRTITIKYDYVSRPFVFLDGEMIFETNKPGFMESVGWEVEWISDDEIRLYVASPQRDKYSNDNYYIKLTDN